MTKDERKEHERLRDRIAQGKATRKQSERCNVLDRKAAEEKSYGVSGFFPECKAHKAEQGCTVRASTWEEAAQYGMEELRKRDGIKGHALTQVRLTITIMGKASS